MILPEKQCGILLELLIAMGNLLFSNPSNVSIARDMDVGATCEEANPDGGDPDDLNDIKELKSFIISLLK